MFELFENFDFLVANYLHEFCFPENSILSFNTKPIVPVLIGKYVVNKY